MPRSGASKKQLILEIARALGAAQFTPAEVEQVRRQMVARHGAAGQTSFDYVASVLKEAGLPVNRPGQGELNEEFEEEFADLLHFATRDDAEACLVRLDELWRRFRAHGEPRAAERVLEVARLGRRRAEMIARNPRVAPAKRAEKQEILEWFRVWLETPDAFFDWLELRKQSPEFRARFGEPSEATDEHG